MREKPVHRRAPHTRVHKGKKVLVLLRDGTRLVDQFHAYTSTTIVLYAYGAVAKADLRSMSIVRGPQADRDVA
jgi:hypothetical protein